MDVSYVVISPGRTCQHGRIDVGGDPGGTESGSQQQRDTESRLRGSGGIPSVSTHTASQCL